jgi:transcription elongation factor GreB
VSRAFTKEDTAEVPLVVPRAPLPAGTPNYVTGRGLRLLREERVALEATRPQGEGTASATALTAYQARLSALDERIQSAVTLETGSLPRSEVRFSAAVSLLGPDGQERCYRIVGVDEAEPKAGRIAFTAPLAAALTGRRVGDTVLLRSPRGELEYEITAIDYAQD